MKDPDIARDSEVCDGMGGQSARRKDIGAVMLAPAPTEEGRAFLAEEKRGVAHDRIAAVRAAAERCSSTTQLLLALACWYDSDLQEPEGARRLREMAAAFAEHEVRTI